MKKIVLLGIFGTALLAACQISPAPSNTKVTAIELGIGNNLAAQAATFQTETGIIFTPGLTVVCNDVPSNLRYIYRRFTVVNNTGSSLTNLQLHAYKKTGNANKTALKSINDFGGVATPDATAAQPRHGLGASCAITPPFKPSADYADLQVYTDTEITSRTTLAGTNLASGENLLGYGYLVRQRSPQTNADAVDRTIENGESGFVTIALKIPKEIGETYNFSMTFLLFTDTSGTKELVQTPEDQFAGTTAGLTQAQLTTDGSARVSVLGGAACGLSGSNRVQERVLLAEDPVDNVYDSELKASSITTTVTSNTDTGAGSLRQAISDATTGSTLCFTQNIILTSAELSITKNLTILAGEGVSISGNNARRVLNISSGNTLNLYGFTVKQGFTPNSGGAGILNDGVLNLFGMTISNNNSESSVVATGGGIQSNGAVSVKYSQIKTNSTKGTGTGAVPALGGGIYIKDANLTLVASTITGNTATGGNGLRGQDASRVTFGTMSFCSPAKVGGTGGSASGGGVYKAGTVTVNGSGLVSGNFVVGGLGGTGGIVPSSVTICNGTQPGPQGATGTTSGNDIAP